MSASGAASLCGLARRPLRSGWSSFALSIACGFDGFADRSQSLLQQGSKTWPVLTIFGFDGVLNS